MKFQTKYYLSVAITAILTIGLFLAVMLSFYTA